MLIVKNQQVGSPTRQPHTSTNNYGPAFSSVPNMSNTTIYPIRPVNSPHTAPINISPAWPTASNVSGTVGYQMAPPRPPTNAQTLPTVYNVPGAVGYQMAPATANAVPQQNIFSFIQQPQMAQMYPRPMIALPPALPRVMRIVECKLCKTKIQTNEYTYVECSNPNCIGRICLLDNCCLSFADRGWGSLAKHQSRKHFINANPNQCLSCKAPKPRGNPNVNTASCPVCNVNWCLVGNCTFETSFKSINYHFGRKH